MSDFVKLRKVSIRLLLICVILTCFIQQINCDSTVASQITETDTEPELDKTHEPPSTAAATTFIEASEEKATAEVKAAEEIKPTEELKPNELNLNEEWKPTEVVKAIEEEPEENGVAKETESSTETSLVREKERAPPHTFTLWDSTETICLLAKFDAAFTLLHPNRGDEQGVSFELSKDSKATGNCDRHNPVLRLSWDKYVFVLRFSKVSNDTARWALTSLDLTYGSSHGASHENRNAKSKDLHLFETQFGKSYLCPSPDDISLYSSKKKVAKVRLHNVQIQPFGIKDANFSQAEHCVRVTIGGSEEKYVRDETVPIAVGLTLAILTLVVVLGFSIYRAYTVKKVDYNTME